MKPTLKPALEYIHRYTVPDNKTVPCVYEESDLFRSMPPVFATAFMVGLMEWACMEALRPHMEEGEISLGTQINVSHSSATPPGMTVSVQVTCLEVDGPRTRWAIVAKDEKGLIGEGTHERFTINRVKFEKIVSAKSDNASLQSH
jgi:fluoroacetyl-CoA thioesterase